MATQLTHGAIIRAHAQKRKKGGEEDELKKIMFFDVAE
jgi:hypothetical protein